MRRACERVFVKVLNCDTGGLLAYCVSTRGSWAAGFSFQKVVVEHRSVAEKSKGAQGLCVWDGMLPVQLRGDLAAEVKRDSVLCS